MSLLRLNAGGVLFRKINTALRVISHRLRAGSSNLLNALLRGGTRLRPVHWPLHTCRRRRTRRCSGCRRSSGCRRCRRSGSRILPRIRCDSPGLLNDSGLKRRQENWRKARPCCRNHYGFAHIGMTSLQDHKRLPGVWPWSGTLLIRDIRHSVELPRNLASIVQNAFKVSF